MDIKIFPSPLCGTIRAISSKSDVHRALFAAALASGETRVCFTTFSEDIKATVNVLTALGAKIDITESGGFAACACGIEKAKDGALLDANECGTTARLVLPIAAALCESFTLTGKNGLLKRPFSALCDCLGENGCACNGSLLPISANGRLKSGIYSIRGDVSSQYISGLLFALPILLGDSEIRLTTPLVSAGYIDMTLSTLSRFGIDIEKTENGFFVKGRQKYKAVDSYIAEGDWSNSLFWLAANAIGGNVTVEGLDLSSHQRDKDAVKFFTRTALSLNGEDMPDALPIIATVLSLADGESVISGGSRLKIKESDRIKTTADMLGALGANITATDDGFTIRGITQFCGGEVDAAGDHRIAMCASIAASVASTPVIIRGADCVNKSYPTFFEDFEKLGGKYSVING